MTEQFDTPQHNIHFTLQRPTPFVAYMALVVMSDRLAEMDDKMVLETISAAIRLHTK